MVRRRFTVIMGILLPIALTTPSPALLGQHTVSAHRKGPHGLVGWTLDYPFPDRPEEHYPRVLVVSRNGQVIRRTKGERYIWKWIFWNEGRQIAYEDGPPHFMMRCILLDVATGKRLADVDCFTQVPVDSPAWLMALEKSR